MTLKTARAENFQTVFGNTGHFSSTHEYRPASGGPARNVDGYLRVERLDDEQIAAGEAEREQGWFQCARVAGGARGYIDNPTAGDALCRSEDSADNPWTFQGPIQHVTGHSWELLFARNRPRRYGPSQSV